MLVSLPYRVDVDGMNSFANTRQYLLGIKVSLFLYCSII